MTTLIDDARGLAANQRLTDDDLAEMHTVGHSKAAELALEMREAERCGTPEARALGIPVLL